MVAALEEDAAKAAAAVVDRRLVVVPDGGEQGALLLHLELVELDPSESSLEHAPALRLPEQYLLVPAAAQLLLLVEDD